MKKISIFLVFILSFFVGNSFVSYAIDPPEWDNKNWWNTAWTAAWTAAWTTSTDVNWDISNFGNYKPKNAVGKNNTAKNNLSIDETNSDLKDIVTKWTEKIAIFSALGAVGALVYAGMLMQFSGGNEETINKAKEVIKITLMGVALITLAGWLVYLVITMIFWIATTPPLPK